MRKKKYLVKLPVPEYIWPDKLDQISIMKPAGVGALSEHPLRSDSEVSLKKTGCGAAQLLEILNPGAGLKWLLRAADNA